MNLTKYQYYKEDIMYKPASIMIGNKDLIKDEVISAEVEEVKGEEDIRICSSCGVKFKGLFKDHECSEEKEITKKEWMNDNINFMKRKSINEETYKQFVVGNWNMDKLIDSKEEPCTNVLKETMKETIEKQKRIFEDILLKREEEAKKESLNTMDDWYAYAKGGFVSKETLERAFTGEKSEVTAYIDKQEEKCEKKGLTYEEWLEEKKEKKRKEDEQKELLKAEKKYKYLAIKVNKEELYNILTQLETMSEVTWFTGDKPTEYNIYKNRGYKPEHLIYLYYTCEENCLGWNSVEGHEREYTEISRESITVEYFINNVCKLHNKEK